MAEDALTRVARSSMVRLHAFEPRSRANGPGTRAVIWFQGCSLGCPGCFNPATHTHGGGWTMATRRLVEVVLARRGEIEGVTLSGGEPFEQPQALCHLACAFRDAGLGVIVFSGFTRDELAGRPYAGQICAAADVLIAGRYVAREHVGRGLVGSRNQEIVLLTARYAHADFAAIPQREAVIRADGSVTWTGIGANPRSQDAGRRRSRPSPPPGKHASPRPHARSDRSDG